MPENNKKILITRAYAIRPYSENNYLTMKVDVCFSPVLYPYYIDNKDTIVVVVDVFRATTTMCMAFNNGAANIMPVATVEEAKA